MESVLLGNHSVLLKTLYHEMQWVKTLQASTDMASQVSADGTLMLCPKKYNINVVLTGTQRCTE